MLLEEAIQHKLYNQMYGINFQPDLAGIHLTNSNRKKICDIELSYNIITLETRYCCISYMHFVLICTLVVLYCFVVCVCACVFV